MDYFINLDDFIMNHYQDFGLRLSFHIDANFNIDQYFLASIVYGRGSDHVEIIQTFKNLKDFFEYGLKLNSFVDNGKEIEFNIRQKINIMLGQESERRRLLNE